MRNYARVSPRGTWAAHSESAPGRRDPPRAEPPPRPAAPTAPRPDPGTAGGVFQGARRTRGASAREPHTHDSVERLSAAGTHCALPPGVHGTRPVPPNRCPQARVTPCRRWACVRAGLRQTGLPGIRVRTSPGALLLTCCFRGAGGGDTKTSHTQGSIWPRQKGRHRRAGRALASLPGRGSRGAAAGTKPRAWRAEVRGGRFLGLGSPRVRVRRRCPGCRSGGLRSRGDHEGSRGRGKGSGVRGELEDKARAGERAGLAGPAPTEARDPTRARAGCRCAQVRPSARLLRAGARR